MIGRPTRGMWATDSRSASCWTEGHPLELKDFSRVAAIRRIKRGSFRRENTLTLSRGRVEDRTDTHRKGSTIELTHDDVEEEDEEEEEEEEQKELSPRRGKQKSPECLGGPLLMRERGQQCVISIVSPVTEKTATKLITG